MDSLACLEEELRRIGKRGKQSKVFPTACFKAIKRSPPIRLLRKAIGPEDRYKEDYDTRCRDYRRALHTGHNQDAAIRRFHSPSRVIFPNRMWKNMAVANPGAWGFNEDHSDESSFWDSDY